MPPTIISDSHDKEPLYRNQLEEDYNISRLVSETLEHNFGPDELTVRFSMLEDDTSGTLTVEIMNGSKVAEVVGNISFTKINNAIGTCLENGVQIKSAYFDINYRREGLATTAYTIIAKHYLLISDDMQTHDGASFWKFKIGDHDNLEVNIVSRPKHRVPYKVCDSDEKPLIYSYSKEEFEPMIWGLEYPNDEAHRFIKANQYRPMEDVVLVALYQE